MNMKQYRKGKEFAAEGAQAGTLVRQQYHIGLLVDVQGCVELQLWRCCRCDVTLRLTPFPAVLHQRDKRSQCQNKH